MRPWSSFPAPYEPEELARAVNEHDITALFLVPTLLRRLLELPKASVPLMPGVRLLLSSGSSLYPEERRRIMRELCPNFFNFYSSSEGGGISLLRPEHPDEASLSVGQVVFGAEVQIIDENHKPVPPGTVGMIRYRGGAVANSYYRNPEESAVAFRDGWYYPGDVGRFDADGFLYLTGRVKDMIIRGGVNIYPAEIEQTLIAHSAVAEAAVVGWPSQERGEEVAAFVVSPRERERGRSDCALPRLACALQDPEGCVLPRRAAEERHGQGAQARAGRTAEAAGIAADPLQPAGRQLTSLTEPSAAGVNTPTTASPGLIRSRLQSTRLPTMRTPFASSKATSTTAYGTSGSKPGVWLRCTTVHENISPFGATVTQCRSPEPQCGQPSRGGQ